MRLLAFLVTALLWPVAAQAADMFQTLPAQACGTPLAAGGAPIRTTEPLDEPTRAGVLAGVFLSRHDPTGGGWSEADLKSAQACPVARFASKERVWTIHSGAGTAPVRLILATGAPTSYALVRGPSLSDAAAWHANRAGLPRASASPAYYLFALSDEIDVVAQIYDGPPAMERLAGDIVRFEDSDEMTPLAGYSEAGGAVSLFRRAAAGPQAEIFRPADLNGERAVTLYLPDGRLLTQADDGGFVFRGSGFTCAPEYGAFTRTSVSVLNGRDEALDLACHLASDTGGLTVFVTRAPDASGDKRYWNDQIAQAEKDLGVGRKLPLPPMGPNRAVQAGRNWVDKDGMVQLLLFLRRGEYLYEVRQSHPPADVDAASQALAALGKDLDRTTAEPGAAESWRRSREQR
jgi:hypothetical protein